MEKLGINLTLLIAQIANFILLVLILRGVAYKPILRFLENRRERIARGLEDARKAEDRLANIEKDYQARMAQATGEAQKIVAERTQAAEQQAAAITAAAHKEAEKIRADAQADAGTERNRILADLRAQVAALSIAAANKVIGAALDEQRQRTLIDEFFSGVKSGKVVVAEAGGLSGKVMVTSALPLTDGEKSSIKSDLSGRGAADVEFRIDPKILGGLVIRAGDRVVDGSVAGRLESLRQTLG